ncbi:hypothetical protein [Metabacillus sp. Hm71]|uniref:hypothetical protein n=1 Tax=Metabacillus sp. Hm71 TaxID=3450743 RepID=UPI003F434B28
MSSSIAIGYGVVCSVGGVLMFLSFLEKKGKVDGDIVRLVLSLVGYGTVATVVVNLVKMFI